MKDGWRTSEFWVSIAAMGVMLAQSFGLDVESEAIVGGVAAVYTAVRGVVKAFK